MRQAAEAGCVTQPEIILDADGMNVVKMSIDKADNFDDVRDALYGVKEAGKNF